VREGFSIAPPSGTGSESRFVSYEFYRARGVESGISTEQIQSFGARFADYFGHVAASSYQFIIDLANNPANILA
jgi:hypothetical protein